jgi:hypothetical protein
MQAQGCAPGYRTPHSETAYASEQRFRWRLRSSRHVAAGHIQSNILGTPGYFVGYITLGLTGIAMAFKARFFIVKVRDGHGASELACPAQSADDIHNRYPLSPYQVIESIDHVGWCEVDVIVDNDHDEPAFAAVVRGQSVSITRGTPGYGYLTLLFPKKVRDINTFFNEQRQGEP